MAGDGCHDGVIAGFGDRSVGVAGRRSDRVRIGRSHAPRTKRSRTRREAPATPTTAAIDDGIAPRRSFVRLGVVERQSSPAGDADARLRFDNGMAEAWA